MIDSNTCLLGQLLELIWGFRAPAHGTIERCVDSSDGVIVWARSAEPPIHEWAAELEAAGVTTSSRNASGWSGVIAIPGVGPGESGECFTVDIKVQTWCGTPAVVLSYRLEEPRPSPAPAASEKPA